MKLGTVDRLKLGTVDRLKLGTVDRLKLGVVDRGGGENVRELLRLEPPSERLMLGERLTLDDRLMLGDRLLLDLGAGPNVREDDDDSRFRGANAATLVGGVLRGVTPALSRCGRAALAAAAGNSTVRPAMVIFSPAWTAHAASRTAEAATTPTDQRRKRRGLEDRNMTRLLEI